MFRYKLIICFIGSFFYCNAFAQQYCYDPLNNFYYPCQSYYESPGVFFSIVLPNGYDNRDHGRKWDRKNWRGNEWQSERRYDRHHRRDWDQQNRSNWDRRNERNYRRGGWDSMDSQRSRDFSPWQDRRNNQYWQNR